MTEKKYTLSIDIGGTSIRSAIFDNETNQLIVKEKEITDQRGGYFLLDQIFRIIKNHQRLYQIIGIGIAAPGPLNPHTGEILGAPNIPNSFELPVKKYLEKLTGLEVKINNDANLAALGEWKFGAGSGHNNLVYLTISTGIGGGVIMDGNLLLGHQGLGTEIGHIVIEPEGAKCSCGNFGHLEGLAAGPALAKQANLPTGKDVCDAAIRGNEQARMILEKAGQRIGKALATCTTLFNPSIIVIGGGISNAGELLLAPLRQSLAQHAFTPSYLSQLKIVPAELGDDSGLWGAFHSVKPQ